MTIFPDENQIVTDKLWSYPSYLQEYQRRGVQFVCTIRADNSLLPPRLMDIASSDISTGFARTYANRDGSLVLQVFGGEQRTTTVISNSFTVGSEPPPRPPHKFSYSAAHTLFIKDTPESLVEGVDLEPAVSVGWGGRVSVNFWYQLLLLSTVGQRTKTQHHLRSHRLGCSPTWICTKRNWSLDLRTSQENEEGDASARASARHEAQFPIQKVQGGFTFWSLSSWVWRAPSTDILQKKTRRCCTASHGRRNSRSSRKLSSCLWHLGNAS